MPRLKKKYRNYIRKIKRVGIPGPKYFIADKGEVSEKEFLKWYNEQLKNF